VNILAIETATQACAVGVRSTIGREVVHVVNDDRRHTEVLTLAMSAILDEARVVVDRGPGLFTGLRVGIATAVAFAQALGCELVGVTSLELLARGAFDEGVRGKVVPCVDGRRGEVFVQTFTLDDEVVALNGPRVAVARDVVIEWATSGAPVTFTGDGVVRYSADFDAVANGSVLDQSVPSLHAALSIGAQRDADDVIAPLYLREADAVANFTTRQRAT
jgi:tRNA threonylcarbamoyladenosine biosynthesis protein TsaB